MLVAKVVEQQLIVTIPPPLPAKLKIITIFEEEKGNALDTNVSEIARVLF